MKKRKGWGRFLSLLLLVFFVAPLLAVKRRPKIYRPAKILRGFKAVVRDIDVRRLRRIPPGKIPEFRSKRRAIPPLERKLKLVKKGDFDPVVQRRAPIRLIPTPIITFAGLDLNNWGAGWPPDTNGDVGKTNVGSPAVGYYIQTVNTSIGIFNKATGELVAAFKFDDFFDGTGTDCDNNNMGDPIVLYDRYLDRWIISDFAFQSATSAPHYECIAMSKTNDPVNGGWYMWGVNFEDNDGYSGNNNMNDYPKAGVWDDGYYFTFNDFDSGQNYAGVTVWALDKNSMASGTMNLVAFFLDGNSDDYAWSLLPANSKGPNPPPSGAPNYLISMGDDAWGGNITSDSLAIYKADVDFDNPNSSTITGPTVINVASFDYDTGSIPQPGTSQTLDTLSSRLMYSAFYWNYGDHETIVVNHTVDSDGNDHAGVRWYEVRDPGGSPTVYQQGTYAPDSNHRWMGSAACDADGNIAIGFSISSSSKYPSIYYAGRKAGDPLGELSQGEASLYDGSGSQTTYSRWGDYSMLTIDPDDDYTFWYTTEYYASTGTNWQTRIGAFKLHTSAPPTVQITNPSDGDTVSGTVTITADASDDVGVTKVEFYIDDVLKSTDDTAPYEYVWDSTTVADGNHTIKAIAYDGDGQTDEDQISVTTDNGVAAPMLVVDLDGNTNSCTYIRDQLQNKGYTVDYQTSMPSSIDPATPATWVCLGVYSNNHVLTSTEGDVLKAYLDAGGKVYMEGGDTWCYDSSTSVHPYFGTWLKGDSNCQDGSGDLATINGIAGTFTEGLSWSYGGDNAWIDHIGANQSDSFNIWDNSSPSYHTGVARDNTSAGYKTIAASHEFGGAGSSDQSTIMDKYLEFFFGSADNPPTASFLYPHDGSAVYSVIRVRVQGSDDLGLNKLEIYLDDALQYTQDCSGATSCDAVWTWDTTTSSVGDHTLKAIAYDTANQTGQQTITVNVHPGYGSHWGGSGDDYGKDIAMDSSGDLLMVGNTTSVSNGGTDILLYRINSNGTKEWHQNYGSGYSEYGESVVVDSSDNIIIGGYVYDGSQEDILVKKLNSGGVEQWSRTLGGDGDDAAYAVGIDSGGNVVVAGYSSSYSYGGYDAVFYKLKGLDGTTLVSNHFGGSSDDMAYGLAVDSSDNVYLVGETSSYSYGGKDIALWKLDSTGSKVYGAHYGGGSDDIGYDVVVSGSYLYIVGISLSYSYGNYDIVVYKLNASDGSKVVARHFGGGDVDKGYGITINSYNGHVIVVGYSTSYSNGLEDVVVYDLSADNLVKNWANHYGGGNTDEAFSVVTDSEGHIYVFGSTNTFTYGGYDFLLYRLSDTGVKMPIGSGE